MTEPEKLNGESLDVAAEKRAELKQLFPGAVTETINENGDPDVVHGMLMTLEELFPKNRPGYRHNEGNSDSHIKSTLTGCSEQVIIANSRLTLGTWQGIYFCEYDGPRNRTVQIQVRGI